MTEPRTIPLDAILIDKDLQPRRDGIVEHHIKALIETPEKWPPVIVAPHEDGFVLVDGFHRYYAAAQLGAESLCATIIDRPADDDLFRIAFEANVAHGLPLSLEDRKAYATELASRQSNLSDREIGRRTGLHHQTVGSLRNSAAEDEGQTLRRSERRLGAVDADIDLFDPIRWARGATRPQKAVAGYLKRLSRALEDPYDDAEDEAGRVEGWCDDIAQVSATECSIRGESSKTRSTERAFLF